MINATVTISLADLDALRKERDAAIQKATELSAKLTVVERDATSCIPSAQAIYGALDDAVAVVSFAVANCPPETTPGWPYIALRRLGRAVQTLPGMGDHRQFGIEFCARADEIEPYEVERANRPKKVMVATPEDFGPQTAEASAVHSRREDE